jgi:hypothetical protein
MRPFTLVAVVFARPSIPVPRAFPISRTRRRAPVAAIVVMTPPARTIRRRSVTAALAPAVEVPARAAGVVDRNDVARLLWRQ